MDQLFAAGADGALPALAMSTDSDPHIISLVRQGVTDAFDILYIRHLQIAQYVARTQTDNPSDADDVVAESFASVFQSLKEGKGPKDFFRSYLLTVVRRTAHDRNRKARRTPPATDHAILDSAVVDGDPVLGDLESSIVARAFKSLPERWQAVLWHLDIEGLKPAAAAPFVGLSPNGVSSLAIRAREGLRQAYLQQHISQAVDGSCAEFAGQLGKYARNALKRTTEEKVSAHLESCAKCTALLMELNDVEGAMRGILFPLVTGIAFTPAAVAAFGASTAAGGSGAVGTAVSGIAAGPRGVSKVLQLTAAVVLGAVALVGILAWLLQSNVSPQSSVAADASTNLPTPPALEKAAPTPAPSAAQSAAPEPTSDPPSVPAADPPVAAAPEQPAVVLPRAELPQRNAVVVGSGTVASTTTPQAPASAAPLTQTVEATFAAGSGSGPTERELLVQFALQGDGAPTTGEAIFTLPDEATFVPGKTVAPEGWTCGNSPASARQIRCTSASLNPDRLSFTLGVSMPQASELGTLKYQFGGQGIVSKSFANTFH
ncbi:sigma-70 family RNA polymerase sigma factor [Paenarthrobacter sp. NPDC056912]|uniref:sigma-70 family RNA polymerase sigma factor n=1 Tax=Paenarthrobacter sp. NPDC056912 TaxID=3345965 RepID=UPI003671B028